MLARLTAPWPTARQVRMMGVKAAVVSYTRAVQSSDAEGEPRARSHCRFVPPLVRFIPDLLTYLVPLFLKRQCDRTPGKPRTNFSHETRVRNACQTQPTREKGAVSAQSPAPVAGLSCRASVRGQPASTADGGEGRGRQVWERNTSGEWKNVHMHRSPLPETWP
jgi:hypothetical protein